MRKLLVSGCFLALVALLPAFAEPVVVQGVPPIGWIAGRFSYHISALQAALQAMGCDATYEQLMVVSGAGFRTAWPPPTAYSYSATCVWPPGDDYVLTGARAVGAKAERRPFAAQEEAQRAVCASLDQGCPVITWEACGARVICGYDPDRGQFHIQSCNADKREYQIASSPLIPTAPPPLPETIECVFLQYDPSVPKPEPDWPAILARAVRFADYQRPGSLPGAYPFGLAAYDAWAASLRGGPDRAGAAGDAAVTETVANTLADARTAVSKVLTEFGTLHDAFPEAAGHYSAEATVLKSIPRALAGGQADLPWAARVKAMAESFAQQPQREAIALLVEEAKAEEKQAVDALRRALKDLGPPREGTAPPTAPAPPAAPTPTPPPNPAADQHYQRGVELKRAGQASQAADELRAAITADPKHVKAHYALGWVLLDLKDKPGAAGEFRKVIELAPDSEEAKEAKKALERIGA
jgi:tetratricopeptide (TPR) repeat protein